MQLTSKLLTLAALALPLSAAPASSDSTWTQGPDKNGKYWLIGDGLTASFIPYGASVSNLIVNDKHGVPRDLVAGFDNATYYSIDKSHPHLGGVPGRYSNRIKNSTFEIDGKKYHVLPNENPTPSHPQGIDTLHGGPDGWDWRNFTVVRHTKNSITFHITDPDGKEGFPGEVISDVTYTVDGKDWYLNMVATSTEVKTPIMLASHVYWNLDGFANDQTQSILDHTLHLPYGGERIGVDNILVPTGDIVANLPGSVNDFWSAPKALGASFKDPAIHGNCGFNCSGYDTCYITNRDSIGPYDWKTEGPVATLASKWSGITLDIFTNQDAFQVYSCNGQNGTLALKETQGLHNNPKFPRTIPKYGCVVLEVEDWIDAINNPQWGKTNNQILGPEDGAYVLNAKYSFSVDK